jgi:hypothetical protein
MVPLHAVRRVIDVLRLENSLPLGVVGTTTTSMRTGMYRRQISASSIPARTRSGLQGIWLYHASVRPAIWPPSCQR